MKRFLLLAIIVFCIRPAVSQTNSNLSNWQLLDGEQYLAVNPANPNNLIVAWMQLKGNLKIAIAVRASTDGGNIWSSTNLLPNLYLNYGAADPSIAFSRSGVAHLCYVDYRGDGTTDSGSVVMRKSTDGGLSWSSPYIVRNINESSDLAADRPWIAVDNSNGIYDGYLYVTSMPTKWAPAGNQYLHMKYSSNGGANWSNDVLVSAPGYLGAHGSSGRMTITANGVLDIAYASRNGINPSIVLAKTTNNGLTFSRTHVTNWSPPGAIDTLYQTSYNITSDPANGQNLNLCLTSQNYSDPDVFSLKSTNGGSNWSSLVRVNKDSINNGRGQDMCWSEWKGNILGIAYRDRRNFVPGSMSPFEVYFSLSTDGGLTFYKEERISANSSLFNQYGYQGNDFLGFSLSPTTVHVTWAAFVSGINWDILYGKSLITNVNQIGTEIPTEYNLSQNYPNPFNPTTIIKFQIPGTNYVGMKVFDLLGREVATLVNEVKQPGTYNVQWNASGVASGEYLYRLQAGDYVQTKKLVLLR